MTPTATDSMQYSGRPTMIVMTSSRYSLNRTVSLWKAFCRSHPAVVNVLLTRSDDMCALINLKTCSRPSVQYRVNKNSVKAIRNWRLRNVHNKRCIDIITKFLESIELSVKSVPSFTRSFTKTHFVPSLSSTGKINELRTNDAKLGTTDPELRKSGAQITQDETRDQTAFEEIKDHLPSFMPSFFLDFLRESAAIFVPSFGQTQDQTQDETAFYG